MHITSENYSYRYRYTSLCQQIFKDIIVRVKYRRILYKFRGSVNSINLYTNQLQKKHYAKF